MQDYFIELGGIYKGYFGRKNYLKIDDAFEDALGKFIEDRQNKDVYYSIYRYEEREIESSKLYAPLYFDLDIEIEQDKDYDKVRKDALIVLALLEDTFGIPASMIHLYFSGSKGFHITVDPKIIGIEPEQGLNDKLKKVATYMKKRSIYETVDTGIYDKKRLFRMPNSINSKTGLYKIPITKNELLHLSYQEMWTLAKEAREIDVTPPEYIEKAFRAFERVQLIYKLKGRRRKQTTAGVLSEKRDLLPCVRSILDNGVEKGGRNNALAAMASSMIQSGLTEEEVRDEAMAWNEKNDPPMPGSEVIRTVQSAGAFVRSGRGYGCNFFKERDFCVGKSCGLFKFTK